jgi:hypothetical protein
MSVPYTFANQTGSIPLSELDDNFASVQEFANTAGFVTESNQANITTVGVLTALNVSGNMAVGGITTNVVVANTITSSGPATLGSVVTGTINATSISTTGNITGSILFASAAGVTGVVNASGGVLSSGIISSSANVIGQNLVATANVIAGNVVSTGIINSVATITGGNLTTAGLVSAAGTIAGSSFSTAGNITGGNIISSGAVNAVNMSVSGNIVIAGNATVNGNTTFINTSELTVTDKTITVANGVSTSALIDGAGIEAGSPAVSYLRYFNASLGWSTADNFGVGGNLIVTGNLSATGNTVLSGNATATTAANGVSTTQLATTEFVSNSVQNRIPAGVIVMWNASIVSIPTGWALCDGANGTPDLRNSFILAAGGAYAVGVTGGSTNAVVVDHTHTATSAVSDPGHNHINGIYNKLLAVTGNGTVTSTNAGSEPDVTQSGNILSANTGITVSTVVANAGVSGSNANMPPYYALAYIMKL